MNKLSTVFKIILLCFLFNSCFLLDDSESLGGGYYLLRTKWNRIIYSESRSEAQRGTGILLNGVEDDVTGYNKNDEYIIYRTCSYRLKKSIFTEYWILDKNVQMTIKNCADSDTTCYRKMIQMVLNGPLDSLSFYKKLDELNIDLKLKDAGSW